MKKFLAAISLCIVSPLTQNTYSFEPGTHKALSEQAVLVSSLDDFLKKQLGFADRTSDKLFGIQIIDWIADGSVREDDDLRFCNHFHNPLHAWGQAGLQLAVPALCGTSNESAVVWGQNLAQGFSWQLARDEYFKGLTMKTKDEREKPLANTFLGLGHLIHLVQDTTLPQHTRNDAHPVWKGLEGYVEEVRANADQGDGVAKTLFDSWINKSLKFDPPLEKLTILPNALASVPIARLIDTEKYRQSGTPSAGTDIGIAEYSNANFLSEDTIFKDFVFPREGSLGPPSDVVADPVTGRPRTYFPKVAEGEAVNRFVAKGVWWETLSSLLAGDKGYILDRGVYEDYARLLLPRAIGYSAGLLDYFFRGRLEVVVVSENPSGDLPTGLKVKVRNNTPDNQETSKGTVVGVLEVQEGDTKSWLVSTAQELEITRTTPKDIVFQFSFGETPPSSGATLTLMVVYKGPLKFGGQNGPGEDQAVVVGRAPLKPLDLNPKDSMFACGDTDPKVTFTASGGLPPYTWSTTKGEVIPIDAQNAELTPSANNANVDPGSTAYMWVVNDNQPATCNQWAGGCYRDRYNCANTALAICEFATGDNCGPSDLLCDCTLGTGCIDICGQVQSKGALKDTRSQAMIDQGCKPCAVEMQGGATVTVTDASGASASTTVAVAQ